LRNDALERGYRAMNLAPIESGRQSSRQRSTSTLTSPIFFDDEELRLMDELAMDIGFALEVSQREAERARAEEAKRTSESALPHALFDYAPDGIVIANPEELLSRRQCEHVPECSVILATS